jgi:hypothetical protein
METVVVVLVVTVVAGLAARHVLRALTGRGKSSCSACSIRDVCDQEGCGQNSEDSP